MITNKDITKYEAEEITKRKLDLESICFLFVSVSVLLVSPFCFAFSTLRHLSLSLQYI